MSAFIVSKEHIDALVTAATSNVIGCANASPFRWYFGGEWKSLQMHDDAGATAAGRMLWVENLRSVAARYPNDTDGGRPGPCNLADAQIYGYKFQRLPGIPQVPVVLGAVSCYEYQSSEHAGWEASEAKAFVLSLVRDCCRIVSGDTWEITSRYAFAPDARPRLVQR